MDELVELKKDALIKALHEGLKILWREKKISFALLSLHDPDAMKHCEEQLAAGTAIPEMKYAFVQFDELVKAVLDGQNIPIDQIKPPTIH